MYLLFLSSKNTFCPRVQPKRFFNEVGCRVINLFLWFCKLKKKKKFRFYIGQEVQCAVILLLSFYSSNEMTAEIIGKLVVTFSKYGPPINYHCQIFDTRAIRNPAKEVKSAVLKVGGKHKS